jgi:2-oxoglutarate ferredoxin oxidoreductase subunit beta
LGPTPIGIFRSVERESYEDLLQQQLVDAQADRGPGDLSQLVRQAGTWDVT